MTSARGQDDSRSTPLQTIARLPAIVRIGLAVSLALLCAHIYLYRFACDDAYISYRYARNLSEGHGLVFNPGFERVEGYTNFLWVVVLGGLNLIGWSPEFAAPVCSAVFGIALWMVCTFFCLRDTPQRGRAWLLLIVPVFLATNRSYAVWCSSGLETKLFELLVVGGVLRTLVEMEQARRRRANPRPYGALLLALGCLTRPDGSLIFVCVLGARLVCQWRDGTLRARPIIAGPVIFAVLVGGHLIFRLAYYGEWLPNTYYAKVGGHTWWSMGWKYLGAFALEYAVWLWLPLCAVGAWAEFRRGRPAAPVLVAAVVIPHMLYVTAVGGDHFEYRPLDLYFPLLFILIYYGAGALARTSAAGVAAGAYVSLCLVGLSLFPVLGHVGAPTTYVSGFPGGGPRADGTHDLIPRTRFEWVFRTPLLRSLAETYNDLMIETSKHYVGLRQEEHKLFLDRVVRSGKILRQAVRDGVISPDLYIAIDCVGAIPYYSRLRTLDRLGLTDRTVARGEIVRADFRTMAHDKIASLAHGTAMGVDVWAVDSANPVIRLDHPTVLYHAHIARSLGLHLIGKKITAQDWAVGFYPGGAALFEGKLAGWQTITPESWTASIPGRSETPGATETGDYDRLHVTYGSRLLERGLMNEAREHFERAVRINPRHAGAHALLGTVLLAQKEYGAGVRAMSMALTLEPGNLEVANNLAWRLATCPDDGVRDGEKAVRLAEGVNRRTGGASPALLDTLAAAYAEVGRFDQAVLTAQRALEIARRQGQGSLSPAIGERAAAYESGLPHREP